jgi:hypothetical protein
MRQGKLAGSLSAITPRQQIVQRERRTKKITLHKLDPKFGEYRDVLQRLGSLGYNRAV